MSIGTDPALWTLLAFAIGLALVVFFPRAVARAMSYLPGHSGHLLNTEETGAFNAAMALPELDRSALEVRYTRWVSRLCAE